MNDWLAASAAANGSKPFLYASGGMQSFESMHDIAQGLTDSLRTQGVQRGHHVALLASPGASLVALIFALGRLGAVAVPLNLRLTVEEMAWQIRHANCHAIVFDPSHAEQAMLAAPETHHIPLRHIEEYASAGIDSTAVPLITLDDIQAIMFTSGTSGQPKGAQITWGNHFWSATASSWRLGVTPDDVWLSVLPLYHVGGMGVIFRSVLYGTAVDLHQRFDVDEINSRLDSGEITLVSLVPTMLARLLDARDDTPFHPRVRTVLLGGAAADDKLLARCVKLGIPTATTYGLTEACSQVATTLPGRTAHHPGSVGRPVMFTSVRIADEAGASVSAGQPGEVVVSGPTVMKGYYQQPEDRALRNGELFTGDIGYLDHDGNLWLLQRRTDLIVTGGENVYPAEVEARLRQHPDVRDVLVVGIPDPVWGQTVAAIVVPAEGALITERILSDWCRASLAGYKCPRRWLFASTLPMIGIGKPDRKAGARLFT
ncbi:MAG: o-succinylbenzoate--CoA ligase [Pleurocapsa minor GSE-CHR-MK-17-07R]|jgi:O-succinylbenzoic acid--CoA ligase|nr:o-succinylbenzoate--CoA ligase [Pleurocapsa minor GSE-CHR-MK 17-07R]